MADSGPIDMSDSNWDWAIEAIWNRPSTPKHMSGRFRAVILEYSDSPEIAAAILEWRLERISDAGDVSSLCICSHKIQQEYFIIHQSNQHILRLGSECIKKFMGEELKADAKILQKQWAYQKKGGGRRMCEGCHRHKILISEPSWKTRCRACFSNQVEAPSLVRIDGRQCAACHRPTIDAADPEWQTICKSCYRAGARSEPREPVFGRVCTTCQQPNIPLTEPEWKKQCLSCYRRR